MSDAIDWDALHAHAVAAMERSYSPYSKFPVGAAAITDGGRIVSGCNIENASYGVTLCAECSLVSDLIMGGWRQACRVRLCGRKRRGSDALRSLPAAAV